MIGLNVRETTATTGTGATLTLSAVTGRVRVSQVFSQNALVHYALYNASSQLLEWGIGTVGASNTLDRSVVIGTYDGTTYATNSPGRVNLSGTTTVLITPVTAEIPPPAISSTNDSNPSWLPYPYVVAGSISSIAVTADRCYWVPFRLSMQRALSAIRMRVATGSAGNVRIGLYHMLTTGDPGARIAQSGDIDVTSNGVIAWSPSPAVARPPGWYYMAFASKGNTPTMNAFFANMMESPLGADTTRVLFRSHKHTALSGGWTDLPDPAPTTGFTGVNGNGSVTPMFVLEHA